jgi:biotin operon repressor
MHYEWSAATVGAGEWPKRGGCDAWISQIAVLRPAFSRASRLVEGWKAGLPPQVEMIRTMTFPRFQPKKFQAASADRGGGSGSSAIVRTQRALKILRLLQAGQVWSAQELAVQFDCSTRTIFRDLQLLRECNIPIDTPRGERGFKLSHDFFWQPERPTLDEMTALVVGARMAEETLPHDMQRNLGSALTKLVGSERPAVRQRLSELNMRIDAPHAPSPPALPALDFLPQLLEHIGIQMPVQFVVAGEADGSMRDLEWIPVRLHFESGQWRLFGTPLAGEKEDSVPLASIVRIGPAAAVELQGQPAKASHSETAMAPSG